MLAQVNALGLGLLRAQALGDDDFGGSALLAGFLCRVGELPGDVGWLVALLHAAIREQFHDVRAGPRLAVGLGRNPESCLDAVLVYEKFDCSRNRSVALCHFRISGPIALLNCLHQL